MKKKVIITGIITATVLVTVGISVRLVNKDFIQSAKESNVAGENDVKKTIAHLDTNKIKIEGTNLVNYSYEFNPTEPESMLEGNGKYLVKAKVLAVGEGEFIPEKNEHSPLIPVQIEVEEVLYGDNFKPKDDLIYMYSGYVSLSNIQKHFAKADLEKMGLANINDMDKENKYIKYESEYSYQLEQNKEYIFILQDTYDGGYHILGEGAGIFTEAESNNSIKNVKTNKEVSKNQLITEAKKINASTKQ